MRASELQINQTRLITPRALRSYALGLGWAKVEGVNGAIEAYSSPASGKRQVIVPLDERLDDYGERAAEAVIRLAEFENRSVQDVLNHLLVPPADLLSFREVSIESESGDVSLEHGLRMVDGAKRALLAVAHSVEVPKAYHPRLSRDEAKKFLSRCRMSTDRGSFVLNVACVLDQPVPLPGAEAVSFTRRVTELFVDTLAALNASVQTNRADRLTDTSANPGISANLCEALTMLRPAGERSQIAVSAAWSRALMPQDRKPVREIQLRQDVFELIEALAPILRSVPEPKSDRFFGFVEELRGGSTENDPSPSGEVRFLLFDQEEELRAKGDLTAEEYAVAGKAHLASHPIVFSGVLHRQPRLNRIELISQLGLLPLEVEEHSASTS